MEYVVFHPAGDGSSAYRRHPSLAEAVAHVEHLRNVEEVTEVEVYALSAVPIALRPYYRVEIPAGYADGSADPSAGRATGAAEVPGVGGDPGRPAGGTPEAALADASEAVAPIADGLDVGRGPVETATPEAPPPDDGRATAGAQGPAGEAATQGGGTPVVEPRRVVDPLTAAGPAEAAGVGRRRGFGLFVP